MRMRQLIESLKESMLVESSGSVVDFSDVKFKKPTAKHFGLSDGWALINGGLFYTVYDATSKGFDALKMARRYEAYRALDKSGSPAKVGEREFVAVDFEKNQSGKNFDEMTWNVWDTRSERSLDGGTMGKVEEIWVKVPFGELRDREISEVVQRLRKEGYVDITNFGTPKDAKLVAGKSEDEADEIAYDQGSSAKRDKLKYMWKELEGNKSGYYTYDQKKKILKAFSINGKQFI